MMQGYVQGRQAVLPVVLRLPNQPAFTLDFVIDTGFDGELALPPGAVATLQLTFRRQVPANLADNSTITLSIHLADIVWNGQERQVEVLATGRRPLLGTGLLHTNDLDVHWEDGGHVRLEPF